MFEADGISAEFGRKRLKIYQLNSLDDLAVLSVLPLWTSKVVAKELEVAYLSDQILRLRSE